MQGVLEDDERLLDRVAVGVVLVLGVVEERTTLGLVVLEMENAIWLVMFDDGTAVELVELEEGITIILVALGDGITVELVVLGKTSLKVIIVGVVIALEFIVVEEEALELEPVSREDGLVLGTVPKVDTGVDVVAGTVMVTVSYTV